MIIHNTAVDFIKQIIVEPVRLVQYDKTLPVIAVKLLKDGSPLPQFNNAKVEMLFTVFNGSVFKIEADSVTYTENETVANFTVTENMTECYGEYSPIISVTADDNKIAGSSYFKLVINKNPIQKNTVPTQINTNNQSINVMETILDLLQRVEALENK